MVSSILKEKVRMILKNKMLLILIISALVLIPLVTAISVYAIYKNNERKQNKEKIEQQVSQNETTNEEVEVFTVPTPPGICELAVNKLSTTVSQKIDDKSRKVSVDYSFKQDEEVDCLDPIKAMIDSLTSFKYDNGSEVNFPGPEITKDKIIFDLSEVKKLGKGKLYWLVQYDDNSNSIEIGSVEILGAEIRQPTTTPTPTTAPSLTKVKYEVKVLSLSYFPIKEGKLDTTILNNSWGEYNMTLAQVRQKVSATQSELISTLEEGSRYRAYKDVSAPIVVDYNIHSAKEYLAAVPISTKPNPWDGSVYMTDYRKILEDHGICNLVENQGVKEVWLWSYTGIGKSGWESNFAGKNGRDISNSDRDPGDMPICGKSYTVYEYNYGRGTSEATEDHMHQFEAIFNFVDSNLFWNKFVGYHPSNGSYSGDSNRRCGWAHYPPNGRHDYDWTNQNYVQSDCMDWNPDSLGKTTTMNCSRWNCDSRRFFIFWMQSLPGYGNTITYQGKQFKNWWGFIADFDNEMNKGQSLTFQQN
ncbi:hypothetical protein JW796_02735 [Candidatus Dojkabacteria bacterium]|nr:hypothetical protein [Candidatus Dojkabacteria bacterium]